MASLYDIDERLLNLELMGVDTETGEVAVTEEDFQRMYDAIQMDMTDKIINTACFIKNLKSDIEQFKAEEKSLAKRRKTKENLLNHLQDSMDFIIKHRLNDIDEDFDGCNKWKLDNPKARISYRKSTQVEILDEECIPDDYKTEETIKKIDKEAIGKELRQGKEISGALLIDNLNLQIK